MMHDGGFYIFSDNSNHTRGFTRATSIHPRSGMINKACPKCGSIHHYPKGDFDVTVEGGSKFPDVLGCGAYPFLIVSEKVLDAWHEANLCCYHTFNVGIAKIKSARLRDQPVPKYYRIEIDGNCKIDLETSGVKIIIYCQECGYLKTAPAIIERFMMIPGSRDGSHLFRDAKLYPRVNFCNQAVLRVASQNKLTNFRFEPMEKRAEFGTKGINYLAGEI
jgi:hypothetical protein